MRNARLCLNLFLLAGIAGVLGWGIGYNGHVAATYPECPLLKAVAFALLGIVLLTYFYWKLHFYQGDDIGIPWFIGLLVGLGVFGYGVNLLLDRVEDSYKRTTTNPPCAFIHVGNDGRCHPDMISLITAGTFDVPPKQWDGPDTHDDYTGCPPPQDAIACFPAQKETHHVTCTDTQRVLLTDEAGKRHCYGFYLLGVSNPR